MAPQSKTAATVNELIAGSVGGAAQVLVGQPLDTIKTRAQIAPRACSRFPLLLHLLTAILPFSDGKFVSLTLHDEGERS